MLDKGKYKGKGGNLADFKDAFISYSRGDSLEFCWQLFMQLTDAGYNVWFDQNDIPLGVDFQEQIDRGIDKADNFIFVISPKSIASVYCMKELDLAIKRNKRIIPLLHIEPQGAEWDAMPEIIGKLNWIYFRQKQDLEVPMDKWENLDDHKAGLEGLCTLLNSHKEYLKLHTQLLDKAIIWTHHQKTSEHLLTGVERQEAHAWLLKEFTDSQAPCQPSDLHCEFISEAKKNAENLLTDAFISYASENKAIRHEVGTALARFGITTWMDTRDIQKGINFEEAIFKGIEGADNFLFFITEEALESEWCIRELEYAIELNKRIIPLSIEKVDSKLIPKSIRSLQYIDFTDNKTRFDFEEDISDILKEFKKDLRYHHQHKVFLVQALKWKEQNKNESILLRGYNLQNAQAWLSIGNKRKKHRPLPIHEEFIAESVAHSGHQNTEIFISYSRKDADFARKLNERLQMNGKTTWFDQDSIAEGSDFQAEINKGIETSDNFIFVISPDAINSPYCAEEVEYAANLNKRFITLNYRPVSPDTMPVALSSVQWLNFEEDFDVAFSQLIRTLDIDREHVQQHNKWQQRAMNWDNKNRDRSLLLRGSEFALADVWFKEAIEEKKKPQPTKLQTEYIKDSDEAIIAASNQEKVLAATLAKRLFFAQIAIGIGVILLFVAGYAMFKSWEAEKVAVEAGVSTKLALEASKKSEASAVLAEKKAQKKEKESDIAKTKAQKALLELEKKEAQLKRALSNAIKSENKARYSAIEADLQAVQAQNAQARAEIAKENAETEARASFDAGLAMQVEGQDPTLALQIINRVYQENNSQGIKQVLDNIYRKNDFYSKNIEDHKDQIYTVAFAPNGQHYLTGGRDSKAILWSKSHEKVAVLDGSVGKVSQDGAMAGFAASEEVASIDAHQSSVTASAFVPNTDFLVTADYNGNMIVWNKKGQIIKKLDKVHDKNITMMKISKNGKSLVTVSEDLQLIVWDTKTWQVLQTIKNAHTEKITSVDFSPDGEKIVTGSNDDEVYIWNWSSGEKQHEFHLSNDVNGVAFSPNGKEIMVVDWDRDATRLNSETGEEIATFDTGQNYAIAYSPSGTIFATGGGNGNIKLWNTEDGRLLKTLKGHKTIVWTLAFSANGQKLISGSFDKTAKIWDIQALLLNEFNNAGSEYNSVKFSPNNRTFAFANYDGDVEIWSVNGKLVQKLRINQEDALEVAGIDFINKGDTIVTAGMDGKLRFWNASSGRLDTTVSHGDKIRTVCVSPDGKQIITAGSDNKINVWQIDINKKTNQKVIKLKQTLTDHDKPIVASAFSPNGKHFVTSETDGTFIIWSLDENKNWEYVLPNIIDFDVYSVSFSPTGDSILCTGKSNDVILCNLDGDEIKRFKGHSNWVLTGDFSDDGKTFITGSSDRSIRLWDIKTGEVLKKIDTHFQTYIGLDLSSDGKFLVALDNNGTVQVRNAPLPLERALADNKIAKFETMDFVHEGADVSTKELLTLDSDKVQEALSIYQAEIDKMTSQAKPLRLQKKRITLQENLLNADPDNETLQENLGVSYAWYSWYLLHNSKFHEAVKAAEKAQQLNPLLDWNNRMLAISYLYDDNFKFAKPIYEVRKEQFRKEFVDDIRTFEGLGFIAKDALAAKRIFMNSTELLEDGILSFEDISKSNASEEVRDAALYFANVALRDYSNQKYQEAIENEQKAIDLYQRASDLGAKDINVDWAIAYGNASYFSIFNNQAAQAVAFAQAGIALKSVENNVWIHTKLAHALLFNNQFEEAKKVYVQWKDEMYDTGGDYLDGSDRFLSDFNAFEKAGIVHPKILELKFELAELEYLLTLEYINFEELKSLNDTKHLLEGADYYQEIANSTENSYEEKVIAEDRRIALLEKIRTLEPDNQENIKTLGTTYAWQSWYLLHTKEFQRALDATQKAIEFNPEVDWVHRMEALSYVYLDNFEEARKIYMQWNHKDYSYNEGETFRDQFISDIKYFEGLDITNSNAAPKAKRLVYRAADLLGENMKTYQDIVKSQDVEDLINASDYFANQAFDKDYNSIAENTLALSHAQHLVDKSLKISNLTENKPKLQSIYWALSWNYIFVKKFKDAEAAFQKAIEFGASDAIYSNLAATYLFSGEWQKAEKIYRKYKDKKDGDDNIKAIFLTDLDELEKVLGKPEHIKEIREMLKK
jgi:WD40 repeat protein/Flp pilus assembly protein TadD